MKTVLRISAATMAAIGLTVALSPLLVVGWLMMLYRRHELRTVYKGDEAARDTAEWRYS